MVRKILLSTASLAALAWCGVAHAQTPPAVQAGEAAQPAGDDIQTSGEVVVTAERRTTNLQTTAVAASVFSGDDLAKKGVRSIDQLQFAMPSVTLQNYGQGNSFNVRGIGKSETSSATTVGVITYRDGVATFPGYFQSEPYYDIASLELLRGPQGTFAGQNATGGAVFITEANPNFRGVHGYVEGQYGNYDDRRLQGAVNLPVSDTLAFRLAFNSEYRDSFYTVTGAHTGDPGKLQSNSVRASMLWQPTDQLKVLFKADYNHIDLGGYATDTATSTGDRFRIGNNATNYALDETTRLVANVSYAFANGITFKSVTGYQDGETSEAIDADGTSTGINTFRDDVSEKIFSQEFNLISDDKGPLTWVAGLYYQHDKYTFPPGKFVVGQPPGVFDIVLEGTNPKSTKAVFGQVSYQLTDGLQLQVGARYSSSETTNNAVTSIPQFGIALPQNDTEKDSKFTGKVALNWKLDDNNFLYGFVATGHKQGGLNSVNLYSSPKKFAPEDVTDIEAGWKATSFGGHLKTQLGAYYNIYKGFQVSITDPTSPNVASILNVAGDTKLYGVEGSGQAIFGAFAFDFGASLSHSRLGTFYAADSRVPHVGLCDPNSGPVTASCRNLGGVDQTYAPRLTLNAGAQYVFTFGNGSTLTPRVDYSHIAKTWATLFENVSQGDRLGARNIVNAQLAYETGPWKLTAYGTNVGDQEYTAAVNAGRRYAGAPRQYGLRLARTF